MRKTFLLISIFLIGGRLLAQDIVNGDFSINNGNDVSYVPGCISSGTNPTFSDTSVLNWVRSHGAPKLMSYLGTPSMHVGSTYLANTPNHPSDGKVKGSGVMGNYNFERNVTYQVEVDIISLSAATGTVNFYAAKDITRNFVVVLQGTSNCSSHIPIAGAKEVIGSITGDIFTPSTHTFTYTPSSDELDKFWVCPIASDTGIEGWVSAWITAIRIKSVCKPQRTFSSGIFPITPGVHKYSQIFAGSFFGSGNTPVRNSAGATTTFRAGEFVDIRHNFIASVNGNNTFTAEIVPCDVIASASSSGPQVAGQENMEGNVLVVFPNPARKEITARYQQPLDCGKTSFIITNSTGQVLLTQVSNGEYGGEEQELQFDISSFSPGTYFIQVSCGPFKETAKFSVVP